LEGTSSRTGKNLSRGDGEDVEEGLLIGSMDIFLGLLFLVNRDEADVRTALEYLGTIRISGYCSTMVVWFDLVSLTTIP
jgi:hypothetical protein